MPQEHLHSVKVAWHCQRISIFIIDVHCEYRFLSSLQENNQSSLKLFGLCIDQLEEAVNKVARE